MEQNEKNVIPSDEEEDLESLRLAALQTLKKTVSTTDAQPVRNKTFSHKFTNFNKRRRGFHNNRPLKNGQFRPKVRASNLISIPVVGSDNVSENNRVKVNDSETLPKLILPQDRYCNPQPVEKALPERTSKFDRYDKSDSGSDYDEEASEYSELSTPAKLERADSLEALMEELENEIKGNTKPEVSKAKPKLKKSRKSKTTELVPAPRIEQNEVKTNVEESHDKKISNENSIGTKKDESSTSIKKDESFISTKKDIEPPSADHTKKEPLKDTKRPVSPDNLRAFSREKSPILQHRSSSDKRPVSPRNRKSHRRSPSPVYHSKSSVYHPYIPPNVYPQTSFADAYVPLNSYVPYDNLPYNPLPPVIPSLPVTHNNYPSTYIPNNVPLVSFGSAPLSPRSAQFVLQNQKIIEKRKMSPRRSYSRSISPVSPRSHRSISSTKSERSLSPRSKITRRSSLDRRLSPNRRPLSPGRRTSPYNQNSPHRLKSLSRHASPGRSSSPNSKVSRKSPKRRMSAGQLSPNRKLSPIRKLSPKKHISPNRRLSPSRRNSPDYISPKGSPSRTNDTSKSYRSPKMSVYDRLGTKTADRARQRSLSLSPEKDVKHLKLESQKEKNIDPVLEARRKKFESSEIPKEGIIRLKTKSDEMDEKRKFNDAQNLKNDQLSTENVSMGLNEHILLDGDDIIDTRIDDIFPEEESDEENEGRFKSSNSQTRSVSVLPFGKLLNGSFVSTKRNLPENELTVNRSKSRKEKNIEEVSQKSWKKERREKDKTGRSADSQEKTERDREIRERSRSPLSTQPKENELHRQKTLSDKTHNDVVKNSNVPSKSMLRSQIALKGNYKSERKVPVSTLLENKKIEIKIRNPSKYEGENRSYDVLNKDQLEERERKEMKNSRKVVEVAKDKDSSDFDEPEPEIIVDYEQEDDEEDILSKNKAGDLRAQLSRKRAERQKHPLESVQSRLLQNALQGAVYKKDKKSKSKKRNKEAAPKEGKLPIHMRLGVPKGETKPKRKRSKNRSNMDQV